MAPVPLDTAVQEAPSRIASWVVSEASTLSIGGEAAGVASDLFGISGLVKLSDGRILVGDRAQRVLMFDSAGSHIRTFGSRGAGPGEFGGALRWIQRVANDTILVADAYNAGRLSYFDPDGDFVRSVTPLIPQGRLIGALSDGSLVGMKIIYPSGSGSTGGVQWGRGEVDLVRIDSGGKIVSSLGVVPGYEWIVPPGLGPMTLDDEASPLRGPVVALAGARIYVATGDRFEVNALDPEGGDIGAIRPNGELTPLTESHLIAFFSELTAGRSAFAQTQWGGLQWNIEEGRTLPAITGLEIDELGNIWIGERRASRDAQQTWHVYDENGRHVAMATMPPRFRPFAIEATSVLGVWRNDLGVEHVQVRAILKN
jgi:hypothetical protein